MTNHLSRPIIRIMWHPFLGFDLCRADYYGWRWNAHIGPLLIWWGRGEI